MGLQSDEARILRARRQAAAWRLRVADEMENVDRLAVPNLALFKPFESPPTEIEKNTLMQNQGESGSNLPFADVLHTCSG
jgi:hypothetical protein